MNLYSGRKYNGLQNMQNCKFMACSFVNW